MDKFTLFELHVHDGMEFSATNTAPAIGRSSDDEEYEELEEYIDDDAYDAAEADDESDSSGSGSSALKLVLAVVALAVLAVAVRKFKGSDADLEIAELDDLSEALDEEEEAEH